MSTEQYPTESAKSIDIQFVFYDGSRSTFKVNSATKFKLIKQILADQKGIDLKNFYFMLDGRVSDETTPQMLDMEDGDEIYVIKHQVGD